jgi:hypothetical protein
MTDSTTGNDATTGSITIGGDFTMDVAIQHPFVFESRITRIGPMDIEHEMVETKPHIYEEIDGGNKDTRFTRILCPEEGFVPGKVVTTKYDTGRTTVGFYVRNETYTSPYMSPGIKAKIWTGSGYKITNSSATYDEWTPLFGNETNSTIDFAPIGLDNLDDWISLEGGRGRRRSRGLLVPRRARKALGRGSPNEERARLLLQRFIGPERFQRYLRDGFVSFRGKSGKTYQIFPGHGVTIVRERGEVIERCCLVTTQRGLPPTDSVIMRMLILENSEEEFRDLSVVTPARPRPRAAGAAA